MIRNTQGRNRSFGTVGRVSPFLVTVLLVLSTIAVSYGEFNPLSLLKFLDTPNVKWQTGDPDTLGFDSSRLDALVDELAHKGTKAFLVIRRNQIAYEWYDPNHGPNSLFNIAALAKSVTASLALAGAMDDHRMSLNDPISRYIPSWADDPQKSQITVGQLATHSAGLADIPFEKQHNGWEGVYVSRPDLRFPLALQKAEIIFEPGTRQSYSGVGFYVLAYALTVSLKDSPQKDVKSFLAERIMGPMGVPPKAWRISYGDFYEAKGMTLYAIGSGAAYTARAMARVGQLILNKGQWEGRQLVSRKSIEALTHRVERPVIADNIPLRAGVGWWLNTDGALPSLPRDAFVGAGAGDNTVVVIPSLDLVMVRTGTSQTDSDAVEIFSEMEENLFQPFMNTLVRVM